jgi:hypothetical protein
MLAPDALFGIGGVKKGMPRNTLQRFELLHRLLKIGNGSFFDPHDDIRV